MKNIQRLFICLGFLAFIMPAKAQSQKDAEDITERFFKTFEQDPVKAYSDLFVGNKWVEKTKVETAKLTLESQLNTMGHYSGYESITIKKAGDSYILKSFLVKFDRQPLRFTFILYKPDKTWKIQNFSYDDNLSDELSEAAKVNLLKENWQ